MSYDPFDDTQEVDVDFDNDDELVVDMDMTGVKEASFEPAPVGDYRMKLEDAKLKRSDKGNISLATVSSIVSDLDGNTDNEGKKVFRHTLVKGENFNDKSKEFVKRELRALTGVPQEGGVRFDRTFFDSIIGNEFDAHLTIKSQKGYADKNEIGYFILPKLD